MFLPKLLILAAAPMTVCALPLDGFQSGRPINSDRRPSIDSDTRFEDLDLRLPQPGYKHPTPWLDEPDNEIPVPPQEPADNYYGLFNPDRAKPHIRRPPTTDDGSGESRAA
ncbi:hypothetical protein FRB99_002527, partial [Tulasnella sp. 403]